MYLLSREVVPHMMRNRGGSIINIGSGWSLRGGPRAASYCAAKGGVVNLTRAMAIDHGKNNIRVNCVCPGDVETPMLLSECAQLGEDMQAFMREAANRPQAGPRRPRDSRRDGGATKDVVAALPRRGLCSPRRPRSAIPLAACAGLPPVHRLAPARGEAGPSPRFRRRLPRIP